MVRLKVISIFIYFIFSSSVFAEVFDLDIAVKPGDSAGIVQVDIFPSYQESSSFRIFVTPYGETEWSVDSNSTTILIPELTTNQRYSIKAVGISSSNEITEASPNETVTAP